MMTMSAKSRKKTYRDYGDDDGATRMKNRSKNYDGDNDGHDVRSSDDVCNQLGRLQ